MRLYSLVHICLYWIFLCVYVSVCMLSSCSLVCVVWPRRGLPTREQNHMQAGLPRGEWGRRACCKVFLFTLWCHAGLARFQSTIEPIKALFLPKVLIHQTFRQLTAAFISGNGLQCVCVCVCMCVCVCVCCVKVTANDEWDKIKIKFK